MPLAGGFNDSLFMGCEAHALIIAVSPYRRIAGARR